MTGVINVLVDCLECLIQNIPSSYNISNGVDSRNSCMKIEGIGLAIPGNVDPIKGTTRYLPNFGWLEEVPLATILAQRLLQSDILRQNNNDNDSNNIFNMIASGLLARIEKDGANAIHMRNDGRCAALAERIFGVGRSNAGSEIDCSVFSMLTLGTGIGGALLYNTGSSTDVMDCR